MRAAAALRNSGKVPAIVYGGELAPVNIQIHFTTTCGSRHVQHEWFYSAILDLSLNGEVQKVLLRDMQRHPFCQQLLHLDFQRVDENKAIRIRVPLHFLNQWRSRRPQARRRACSFLAALNDVEISCLPKDLPEYIEIDLLRPRRWQHRPSLRRSSCRCRRADSGTSSCSKEYDVAVVTAREMKEEVEAAPMVEAVGATGATGATGAALEVLPLEERREEVIELH